MEIQTSSAAAARPEVPGYQLLEVVGHGPLGVVYRARSATGALMAVKLFSPMIRSRPDFVASFERETGMTASLHHPNILPQLQRGRAGREYFVACDLMPGRSLPERLRVGRMTLQQVVRLGIDIGRALDHAHQRRILHRGLKPENVFVTESGTARVGDFSQTRLAGLELQVGRYAPPEAPQSVQLLDGRADVYAAGAILYELLTGERPSSSLLPLASTVAGADARLDAFFQRALARNPEERFARAAELTEALTDLLEKAAAAVASTVDSPLRVTVEKNVVHTLFQRWCTPEALVCGLPLLEQAIQAPGRWTLAYDLSELRSMGVLENAALIDLHQRFRQRLDAVYFHSPRAHVRGSAMVVGGSVEGVPYKVFDSAESMKRQLGSGGQP